MTSKCSSSATGRRTESDKMASMKRIAVVAAVVLLLSMAVVGSVSAAKVTITTTPYDDQSGHGVTYMYSTDGGTTYVAYSVPFDVTANTVVTINAICSNSIIRPQDWEVSTNVMYSSITKEYDKVTFTMPASAVGVTVMEGKLLPIEYTECEYIESTGTQYIDTGKPFNDGDEFYFKWMKTGYINGGENKGYGATKGNDSGSYNITGGGRLSYGDKNTLCVYVNGSEVALSPTVRKNDVLNHLMDESWYISDTDRKVHFSVFDYNTNTEYTATCGSVSKGWSSIDNVYLFRDSSNQWAYPSIQRVYACWLKRSTGVYAFYLVPCKRASDGKPGMYDLASNTFLVNQGSSDDFTAGSDIGNIVMYSDNSATSGAVPIDANNPYMYCSFVTVLDNTGDLKKDGCDFAGWTLNQDGSGDIYGPGQTFVITANTTLYAKWVTQGSAHYTVAYNANGATSGAAPFDEKNPYASDAEVTVKDRDTLVKTGYSFAGWTLDSGGSGDVYGPDTEHKTYTIGTGNVVFYSKWTPNTYTITYMDKGGSAYSGDNKSSLPATHTYDTKTTLVDGTKTGYTFAGWFKESDCSGTAVTTLGATEYMDNITLYAKWTPITYTVRYNANGGTGTMTDQEFTYDVSQNLRTNVFVKNGCTFSGWATEEHGSVVYSDTESVSNLTATQGDIVNLYAVWDTITYTFVIPAALSLDGSGSATTADYSITMTSTQVSGDSRKINMNLTGSVNYDTENDAFRVKNLYSENYQEYTVKKSDNTLVKRGDTIVSVRVDGSDGTTKTEILSYRLTGSTAYAGTYQDTLTFEVSVKSRLPAGYTEVEYIESTGTQYIDTGVHFQYGDEFYFKWMKTGYNSGENKGYGAMNTVNQNTIALDGGGSTINDGGGAITMWINGGRYTFRDEKSQVLYYANAVGKLMDEHWYINSITNDNIHVTMHMLKDDGSIDKIYTLTGPVVKKGWNITGTVYLFRDSSTQWSAYSSQKVYSCWLKRSTGEYAFYLIPCIRNSDSKPGMYDLVSGTFLVNQGSGEFTYGSGITYNDVTNVSISGGTSVTKGSTLQLTANVTPVDATNQVVSWKSSDTSVATVDFFTGKVTGVAAGTATITATVNDYPVKTATCEVTVNAAS